MKSTITLLLLIVTVGIVSCQGTSDGVSVMFREIKNDIAYFDIRNQTSSDIMSLNLEISYLDRAGQAVLVDTISYSMAADSLGMAAPFLTAGSETFIVQSIAPESVTAKARLLSSMKD